MELERHTTENGKMINYVSKAHFIILYSTFCVDCSKKCCIFHVSASLVVMMSDLRTMSLRE